MNYITQRQSRGERIHYNIPSESESQKALFGLVSLNATDLRLADMDSESVGNVNAHICRILENSKTREIRRAEKQDWEEVLLQGFIEHDLLDRAEAGKELTNLERNRIMTAQRLGDIVPNPEGVYATFMNLAELHGAEARCLPLYLEMDNILENARRAGNKAC